MTSSDLSSHDFSNACRALDGDIFGEGCRDRKEKFWEKEKEEEVCRCVRRQHCGEIPFDVVCGNARRDV